MLDLKTLLANHVKKLRNYDATSFTALDQKCNYLQAHAANKSIILIYLFESYFEKATYFSLI